MNKPVIIVGTSIICISSLIVFMAFGFDLSALETSLLIGLAINLLIIVLRHRKSEKKSFLATRSNRRSKEEKESVEYAEYKRDQLSFWIISGNIVIIYFIVVIIGYLCGYYWW